MPKLCDWLLEEAEGEPIEAVVIGEMGWGDFDKCKGYDEQPRGVILSWKEALPHISYDFDSGYGAPKCNCIVAWTKSWIISVSQYDGSTCPFRIPRNPIDFLPDMPGG